MLLRKMSGDGWERLLSCSGFIKDDNDNDDDDDHHHHGDDNDDDNGDDDDDKVTHLMGKFFL